MRLLYVKMVNFMGYVGEHTLALDGLGLTQIAGVNLDDPGNDSNGAAKTTILEAITWCLFGEGLPRRSGNSEKGISGDEVCNDRLANQCSVEVQLEDEGTSPPTVIGVMRWRKWKEGKLKRSSGVSIRVGEEAGSEAYLDVSEGDRRIRNVLGITREIWCRAVVFGQESAFNFCDATTKDRSEILTTVLGLEALDRWLGMARDERTGLRERLAGQEGELTVHRTVLAGLEAERPDLVREQWEVDRARRLSESDARLAQVSAAGQAAKAGVTGEAEQRAQFAAAEQAYNAAVGELGSAQRQESVSGIEERVERARGALSLAQRASALCQAPIAALDRLAGIATCPSCYQTIPEARRLELRQFHAGPWRVAEAAEKAAQEDLFREVVEHGRLVREASASAAVERNRLALALATARMARDQAAARVAALDRAVAEVSRLRREWSLGKEARDRLAAEPNPYTRMVETHAARLRQAAESVVEAGRAIEGTASEIALLNWWEEELPRFRTWLFDSVVDALAAEANRWLAVLSGGVIWVGITTIRELKSGDRRDELDVQVYRANPDGIILARPYRLWSGGEKRRIALAVDLGLSRLMAGRAAKAYSFCAFDEIDRHLDALGREGLREVLNQLHEERETVLVISHDQEFKASFCKEIIVTKQNGQSRFEVREAARSVLGSGDAQRSESVLGVDGGDQQPRIRKRSARRKGAAGTSRGVDSDKGGDS
jgi:DNA repair exonuclease SbcCD ATPase subunit